jgi:hypothetical protein
MSDNRIRKKRGRQQPIGRSTAVIVLFISSIFVFLWWYDGGYTSHRIEGTAPVISIDAGLDKDSVAELSLIYEDKSGAMVDLSPLTGFRPRWDIKEATLSLGAPDRVFKEPGGLTYAYKRPGGEVCLLEGPYEYESASWQLEWRPDDGAPELLILNPELLRQITELTPADRVISVGLQNDSTGLIVSLRMSKYKVHHLTLWRWDFESSSISSAQNP